MTIENPPPPAPDPHNGQLALESLQDELARMDEKNLPPYNLDGTYAPSAVFTAMTNAEPFMADIGRMPTLDIKPIERLPTFAHALDYANTLVQTHTPAGNSFDSDLAIARVRRETLFRLADVQADEGNIPQKSVDDLRAGTGTRDVIEDIKSLHALLLPFASAIGKVELLNEVKALADRLTHGLTGRKSDPVLAKLLLQRQKVAALLVDAHKELELAMAWLRRKHTDPGALVPSIYVPAGRPKASNDATPKPDAPKPAPANPVAPAKPSDPRSPSDNPFDDKK